VKNEFELAFKEITELRALPQETVLEALKTALVSAYRRDTNASAAQSVEAIIDPVTGRPKIMVEKEVVDDVFNPDTEVTLEHARFYDPECQLWDTVMVEIEGTMKKFGRIAAQTAKQVILQKIREAERNALFDEFIEKEGDIVNGTIQSINNNMVTVSLGRAEAIMPKAQQIKDERYREHDKLRVYVLEVKKSNRGPQIIVSRSHRNMLRRLLEFEVPEIYNGQIEIKNIAREAGYRSKVAVVALQEGIDPVGACVGMRGIRIQNIVTELHGEKIDVIEWNPKQEVFIEKALSPARVTGVYLDDDPDAGRTAVVIVPDDQLSLAIGREGQNARLAAKLTGWRIDIKSLTEAVNDAINNIDSPPLVDMITEYAPMLAEVGFIREKREANRAIMPEDYRTLSQFADLAERRLQKARDEARQVRVEEINAVKSTLPAHAFEISVTKLDLPDSIIEALQPLENVGEIMLRFLIDETRLRRLLGKESDSALPRVQNALDKLVYADDFINGEPVEVVDEPENVVELEQFATDDLVEEEPVLTNTVEEAPVLDTFPEPIADPIIENDPISDSDLTAEISMDDLDEYDEDDSDDDSDQKKGKKKKRRQLIFDEETGQTYAKRGRKGSRKRDSWDDF
jgi:N utilization substance protein A